jgi:G6PDH family F420-dependent oxidoreductase
MVASALYPAGPGLDFRSLSSVAGRTGREQFRLVGDRRHLPGHLTAHNDRGDLPAAADPSRDHRPGGRLLTSGQFTLGVGTGEALNEHIFGTVWPSAEERLEMLEEAIEAIRELFTGRLITHHGKHYRIDTARLYSVPDQPPPIFMSGFGEKAIKLAARLADGYMCVQPNADFVRLYRDSGGDGPVQGGLKVCWDNDAAQARKTMHRLWPNDVIPGESAQLLPLPRHFAQLSELVSEDMISAPCGPSPDDHIKGIRAYVDAGFDEVYINQVGSGHAGFFEFYADQVLPRLREG